MTINILHNNDSLNSIRTHPVSTFDQLEEKQDNTWPNTNYLVFISLAIIDLVEMHF